MRRIRETERPQSRLPRRVWLGGFLILLLFVVLAWVGCLLRQMHFATEFERAWRAGDTEKMNSLLVGDRWIDKNSDDGAIYYTLEHAGRRHESDEFYDPANPGSIYISPSDRVIPYDFADFWEFKYYYVTGRREIQVAPNSDCEGRFDVTITGVHVSSFYSGLKALRD